MYKSFFLIISKFVEKLNKYRIMFKDILTFLGLDSGNDYRVATLSKSYLTTTGITMQSLKSIEKL